MQKDYPVSGYLKVDQGYPFRVLLGVKVGPPGVMVAVYKVGVTVGVMVRVGVKEGVEVLVGVGEMVDRKSVG